MLIEAKEYNSYLQKQVLKDLDKRNINGTYIYLAAWLLIGGATGFYVENTLFYWLIASILLLLGVVRILVYFYIAKSPKTKFSVRVKWHYINALLPSMLYSILFAMAMYLPKFEELFLYLLMAFFALLSAGTLNFAPIKNLSIVYVTSLTVLPLSTALFGNEERIIEGLMLILYASYMLLQAMRVNKEYLFHVQQQFALERLNLQDSLTGISNRRHFDETIASAWKTSMRSGSSLILMLIDIDFFKRVNDQFGHAAGDQVIKKVASIIQSACRREGDIAARLGGEEFAILHNNYGDQKIDVTAEEIRAQIEAEEISIDGKSIFITCSFGIATTSPTRDKSIAQFYKVADKCLYAAKGAGRNQVVTELY